jgi:hypothetical protein
VITASNTFTDGQVILISEVGGMTQINGRFVTILSADASTITIDRDTTSYSAYTSGGLATISPLGMQIGKVISTADANTFTVDIPFSNVGYVGLGQYTRLSQPLLQTKQFNPYWPQGRQVRLGVQKYLMDYTADAQITVNVYLSQDPDDAWNSGSVVPTQVPTPTNNSLIYSNILFTSPETNNLQTPTAQGQYQIWHRMSTSLLGDTFQIGLTLSDAQMRNLEYATSEITVHAIQLTVFQGPSLA